MLGNLRNLFSVIGVSETWLNDTTAEQVNVTGYNFVSNHRKSKSGGGVGIYLQNDLEYKLRPDCNLSDPEVIETLFVEIIIPHGKNIIVGTVYRPPNRNITSISASYKAILKRQLILYKILKKTMTEAKYLKAYRLLFNHSTKP